MRYYITLTRLPILKKMITTAGENIEKLEVYTLLVEMWNHVATLENPQNIKHRVVCVCVCVLVIQSCSTLCNPMGYNSLGFSVHGILQVRILEWVTIPFPRGSSQLRDQTQVSLRADSLLSEPPGKPRVIMCCAVLSHLVFSNSLQPNDCSTPANREAQEYWSG